MDPNDSGSSILTGRFEDAFHFAARLHADQKRKGTQIPYLAHLLGVTALVLEDGGNEDAAIAALLHDAVEDQGGVETLEDIRIRFGERVAFLVVKLTDSYTVPKPPWKERKENYVKHLRCVEREVRRISLADKLHNARSIYTTLQLEGDNTWRRFTGGKEGTLCYYEALVNVFTEKGDDQMTKELERVVSDITKLASNME